MIKYVLVNGHSGFFTMADSMEILKPCYPESWIEKWHFNRTVNGDVLVAKQPLDASEVVKTRIKPETFEHI